MVVRKCLYVLLFILEALSFSVSVASEQYAPINVTVVHETIINGRANFTPEQVAMIVAVVIVALHSTRIVQFAEDTADKTLPFGVKHIAKIPLSFLHDISKFLFGDIAGLEQGIAENREGQRVLSERQDEMDRNNKDQDQRMDHLEERQDTVEKSVNNLNNRLDTISNDLSNLKDIQSESVQNIKIICENIDILEAATTKNEESLETMEAAYKDLLLSIASLKTVQTALDERYDQLNQLHQESTQKQEESHTETIKKIEDLKTECQSLQETFSISIAQVKQDLSNHTITFKAKNEQFVLRLDEFFMQLQIVRTEIKEGNYFSQQRSEAVQRFVQKVVHLFNGNAGQFALEYPDRDPSQTMYMPSVNMGSEFKQEMFFTKRSKITTMSSQEKVAQIPRNKFAQYEHPQKKEESKNTHSFLNKYKGIQKPTAGISTEQTIIYNNNSSNLQNFGMPSTKNLLLSNNLPNFLSKN